LKVVISEGDKARGDYTGRGRFGISSTSTSTPGRGWSGLRFFDCFGFLLLCLPLGRCGNEQYPVLTHYFQFFIEVAPPILRIAKLGRYRVEFALKPDRFISILRLLVLRV
jgi:hypothetical protein